MGDDRDPAAVANQRGDRMPGCGDRLALQRDRARGDRGRKQDR
jgi:hypothetical protein